MVLGAWLRCIHYEWRPLGALFFPLCCSAEETSSFAEPSRDVGGNVTLTPKAATSETL